jgi:hypothetical protein
MVSNRGTPAFTDTDLDNLKKCIATDYPQVSLNLASDNFPITLGALIKRLETAEKYIEVGITQSINPTELAIAELHWREASGRL